MTIPRVRSALTALALAAGAALVLAMLALLQPSPAPARAAPRAFSAHRTHPDIAAIAQRPHPIGSADSARVRDYLVGRLQGMGLTAGVRPGPVANIVGLLPGTDPAAPALVLMSHYDSTPHGPGAGDDAAGVAASLEVVRALKAAGPHKRDVMVLITDGEEAGLLGAKAFFGADPLRSRVGVILNMEARGNRGRTVMFETHRDAGGLIAWLAGSGVLKGASSLMPDLYRRLPNDTDLSVALRDGRQGLNFAFFGGQAAYHTAADTPANLDLGSVQHMGDQVLAIAAVLADAPALPGPEPDRVYGDLLGGPVLAYPPAAGWLILILAAGLAAFAYARSRRDGAVTGREVARGAAGFALLTVVQGFLLTAAGMVVLAIAPFPTLLERYGLVLGGYALISLEAAVAVLAACALAKGRWARTSPIALSLGALAVVIPLAALTQTLAPMDAFILAWPALAAATGIAALRLKPGHWAGQAAAAVLAAVTLGQIAYWAGLMFLLVGVAIPTVLAPFAALAAMVAMPWAAQAAGHRRALVLAALIAGAGIILLGLAIR